MNLLGPCAVWIYLWFSLIVNKKLVTIPLENVCKSPHLEYNIQKRNYFNVVLNNKTAFLFSNNGVVMLLMNCYKVQ